jgi:flavin reductase
MIFVIMFRILLQGASIAISRTAFREAMAHLGAAVNIITTDGPGGRCGFTASAVCSLTDDPATVIVCMSRTSTQNAAFRKNAVACINILTARQQSLSDIFAGRRNLSMPERFACAEWSTLVTGAAVLDQALVSLDCRIIQSSDFGTHNLFICRVVALTQARDDPALIYFGREFHAVNISKPMEL